MVRGCPTTVDDCIWNKFSVHFTSSCILEVSLATSTQLPWGSTYGSAKELLARWKALAQALTNMILSQIPGEVKMRLQGRTTGRKKV